MYRRSPALGCGIAAPLLTLTGLFVATVASERLRRDAPTTSCTVAVAVRLSYTAWAAGEFAVVMFLYGAAMKQGLSSSRPGWHHSRSYYYGCTELRSGTILSAVAATAYAIAAYVYFQRTADEPTPGQFVAPGVAMGQPAQWAQPYPPPPMGYSAPPQYGHDGYGPRQPAGTALSSMHSQFRGVVLVR